jgi:hypothetical protein
MNARKSENYLSISRSSSASKSVQIVWAEIYRGRLFLGSNLVSFNQTLVPYEISKVNFLVPCSTLTHSTDEDLLNIKHKGDAKSQTLSPTSDTTETRNPCVIKVILLACSTNIDIFKFIKSLLTY